MIQQVLELTLNHLGVQFELIGLIFYSINRQPDNRAVSAVSAGYKYSREIMHKFMELK